MRIPHVPRRLPVMLAVTVLLLFGTYLVQGRADVLRAAPRISLAVDDAPTEEQVKTTTELIDFWRARTERDPKDFISLGYLAQMFMRHARETGDVADYERADAALNKAMELNPNYEVTLAYQAAVRYAMHDFSGALEQARRVYMADPGALQALATLADAQLELGDYADAAAGYQQLGERSPGAAVYSRLARLAFLQGRPSDALGWMRKAADDAQARGLSGEGAAWYQFQVGELYFNTGRLDEAATNYAQALNTYPNYYLALGGLAKVRAAQGDYAVAIKLYEHAVAIIPQPDLLAALGDVYALSNQSAQAQQQYDTVEFIGKLAAINRIVYNRQLALFYANHDLHVDTSVQLSTSELAARKDIYAYDAAAWSLYKTGSYRAAADDMQQALRLGTRDALLLYHAGMIQAALGDSTQAKTLLGEALSINPNFDLRQAGVAHAELARFGAN